MLTTLKLASCLVMLLVVLTGCPAEPRDTDPAPPPTGEPAPPPINDTEPQEPITTPDRRNDFNDLQRNDQRNDLRNDNLSQQIEQRLEQEQLSQQARDVRVREQNGRVTLEGTVRDQQESQRIEQLAEQVAGPGNVDNRLQVEQEQATPNDQPRPDF